MAEERENFEIDFKGGTTGSEWDTIGGHHSPPLDPNLDRPESSFTYSPRMKQASLGEVQINVFRQEDLRAEGVYAIRVVDRANKVDKLFPIGSIVSRINDPRGQREMIWFREAGEIRHLVVPTSQILEKRSKKL